LKQSKKQKNGTPLWYNRQFIFIKTVIPDLCQSKASRRRDFNLWLGFWERVGLALDSWDEPPTKSNHVVLAHYFVLLQFFIDPRFCSSQQICPFATSY